MNANDFFMAGSGGRGALFILRESARGCAAAAPRAVLASPGALAAGCGSLPTNVGKTDTLALPPNPTARWSGSPRSRRRRPSRPAFGCCRSAPSRSTRGSSSRGAPTCSLDVQYYHFEDDPTGRLLLRALRDAAQRGVRVRLLVDDLYTAARTRCCAAWRHTRTSRCGSSTRLLRARRPRGRSCVGRRLGRLNHRMHNKLFIADGAMAVIGGRNIADEYFLRSARRELRRHGRLRRRRSCRRCSIFDRYWNSEVVYPLEAVGEPRGDRRGAHKRVRGVDRPARRRAAGRAAAERHARLRPDRRRSRRRPLGLIWGKASCSPTRPTSPSR